MEELEKYILILIENLAYFNSASGSPTRKMPNIVICKKGKEYTNKIGRLSIEEDDEFVIFKLQMDDPKDRLKQQKEIEELKKRLQ